MASVEKTILLDFSTDDDVDVTPLDDTSVLVRGQKQNADMLARALGCKLARVNLLNGEEIFSVDLRGWAYGIATICVGGRKVLAVSGGPRKKIEFRDVKTLQLISPHSVDPHKPDALCVSSPSTLLYDDNSQVHCLFFSVAKLRHVGVIDTELDWIDDMCVVKNGGVELLVCVGPKRITAQDLRTGEVKWRVDRSGFEGGFKPCSVTSDGRGHVYICDKWHIQTFHVSDGRYLGPRQRVMDGLRRQRITEPRDVRWNSADSSLVVSHVESVDRVEKRLISVVRISWNIRIRPRKKFVYRVVRRSMSPPQTSMDKLFPRAHPNGSVKYDS